jgi:glutamine amidotransferase
MMHTDKIVVIDYGMGNLWSVLNAVRFLGADAVISSDPADVSSASALVLPGVGSFRKAMAALHERGLKEAIDDSVRVRRKKILGICLGFQMLAQTGTEDGFTEGLGYIPGIVERFNADELKERKLPHIGFNQVRMPSKEGLFNGFEVDTDFYFVHSYRLLPKGLPVQCAICNYGTDFVAAYQSGNVFGTQFHPEKSQTNGLRLLSNFLRA